MTVADVFAYVESFTNLEKTPGTSMRPYRLDRMRQLLALFENPERACRVIHIAGSKGKGSTGVFIAAILDAAGYRTGLYTSPHVSSYKERITLAGTEIDDAVFIEAFAELQERIPGRVVPDLPGKASPTTFELLTLLGFLMFRRLQCQWAVIETGIGGRLDATNLVVPEASVITPVELEHTEVLGDTIEQIAYEKSGIIKQGAPVYTSYQRDEAYSVLAARAEECGAPFVRLCDQLESVQTDMEGQRMRVRYRWKSGAEEAVMLSMAGSVQAENAALALTVCKALLAREGLSAEAIEHAVADGLGRATLPGRMEVVRANPLIVLDAAHTPSSVSRILDSFLRLAPPPRHLIFGSVLGKRHGEMAGILAPHFDRIVVSTPGAFKASDPKAVWKAFQAIRHDAMLHLDPRHAFEAACDADGESVSVLVTGSFYMISEIRRLLSESVVGESDGGV